MNKSKPKLALFISSLEAGGAERVVSLLLPELIKTYEVSLILLDKKVNYCVPQEVEIIILNNISNSMGRFLSLAFLALQYKKICQYLSIETSLSFLNRPNYIAILAKMMGLNAKIVISERAMPSLQHKQGIKGFVNRWLIRWLYPKADEVVINSLRNAYELEHAFGVKDIKTINNPILSQQPLSLSCKKNSSIFQFITIGRLDEGKNHFLLINAMQHVDATLWIIGEGKLKKKLERHIKALGLTHKIKLLGYQSESKEWLLQADAFVFSSLHEGFPNVLLEALSCGLPIISTDCLSGPREILAPQTDYTYQMDEGIEEAEFGILVPVNDTEAMQKAMQKLLDDENLCKHYYAQALKRAQDFAIEPILGQWRDVLEGKHTCVA